MNNWERKKVNELFDIVTGTTPSTKELKYWNGGDNLWITPTDLSKLKNNIYIFNTERKITSIALKEVNLSELPINSIILSTRAPVGYVAIIKKEATLNQGCKAIVAKENNICSEFYYYYFLSIRNYLESISSGSTFKELSKDTFSNIEIVFPPLIEQKVIAEILLTVDKAIQKSNEAITGTERIMREMMNKLLTQGIGHKNFKETKIGKIPSEWDVIEIKELGEVVTGKTPPTSNKKYWIGQIPFITPGDIDNSKYIKQTERKISREAAELTSKILPANSISVVCIGSTIGKIGLTVNDCISNQQINTVIADKAKYNAHFIYYMFSKISKKFKSFSGIAAVPIISKSLFEKIQIPIPQLNEQNKIADILSEIDCKIELEKERKQKFINIKKSLMNDLLTGKKRIKSK